MPLTYFFTFTFLVAWTIWFAAAAMPMTSLMSIGIRALCFLPGTFAPGLVALWLTRRDEGEAGMQALADRLRIELGARPLGSAREERLHEVGGDGTGRGAQRSMRWKRKA